MRKYSRQREAIINFLDQNRIHPTAETVYNSIKEIYPHISLATVYRNLTQLADNGDIQRLTTLPGEPDRFDYNTSKHYHLICSSCGNLIDIYKIDDFYVDETYSKDFGGLITGHDIKFFGLCPDCYKKQNMVTK